MLFRSLALVGVGGVLLGCGSDETVSHVDDIHLGTPPSNSATVPSVADYETALAALDLDAVKADMKVLLKDSKDWWPADGGNYAGLMVRLAWHCSGSFRGSDNVGGCGGGRQRFEPETSWPDNTNLDKARALLAPLKRKYGDGLSWGDLIILAGTTAYREAGMNLKQMCFGRIDEADGTKSESLGPTALQRDQAPCLDADGNATEDGQCHEPLGATTVGLVYVNPEGPMSNPDPALSALDVERTFTTMGHSVRTTVALVGGGHALGKCHGACKASEHGAGKTPKETYANDGEFPWVGTCEATTNSPPGIGANTMTSGFEGPWTTQPDKWDNEYFDILVNKEWEKHQLYGDGPWQWRIKDAAGDIRMMTTADMAMLEPPYRQWTEKFATDMDALNEAFDEGWSALTLLRGSGTWATTPRCDSGEFPEEARNNGQMLNTDFI